MKYVNKDKGMLDCPFGISSHRQNLRFLNEPIIVTENLLLLLDHMAVLIIVFPTNQNPEFLILYALEMNWSIENGARKITVVCKQFECTI